MQNLDDRSRELLDHLRAGGTIATFAAEQGYSLAWGKLRSQDLRSKLGVSTLREAVKVAAENEETVSRAEFAQLRGMFEDVADALEELRNAAPAERPAAQAAVERRELSLKDHAKALGLTVAEVTKLQEEKDYARFKTYQERLETEKAAAAAESAASENGDGEEDGEQERSKLGEILDGLGGKRNVR